MASDNPFFTAQGTLEPLGGLLLALTLAHALDLWSVQGLLRLVARLSTVRAAYQRWQAQRARRRLARRLAQATRAAERDWTARGVRPWPRVVAVVDVELLDELVDTPPARRR